MQQINGKQIRVVSMWHWDSNSRPLQHESPLITSTGLQNNVFVGTATQLVILPPHIP